MSLLSSFPRVAKGKNRLPRNNQEPYLPMKSRGGKIIHAPSEIDCISTPWTLPLPKGVGQIWSQIPWLVLQWTRCYWDGAETDKSIQGFCKYATIISISDCMQKNTTPTPRGQTEQYFYISHNLFQGHTKMLLENKKSFIYGKIHLEWVKFHKLLE